MLFLFSALVMSCQSGPQASNVLKIEVTKDSCYKLIDSANRHIEIIENTLQDTVVLGFAVLPPKYVGNFNYLRSDERVDAAIYPETPEHLMPKTKMICINLYARRKNKGHLVIKFKD